MTYVGIALLVLGVVGVLSIYVKPETSVKYGLKALTDKEKKDALPTGLGFIVIGSIIVYVFSGSNEGNPKQQSLPQAAAPQVATSTPSQPQGLSSDAKAFEAVRSQMNDIETQYTDDGMKVAEDFERTKKASSDIETEEISEDVIKQLQAMSAILDKSALIQDPVIQNPQGRRYVFDAIDSHKKWALTQQLRLAAILKLDKKSAKSAGDEADNYASQEGVALVLASKTLEGSAANP